MNNRWIVSIGAAAAAVLTFAAAALAQAPSSGLSAPAQATTTLTRTLTPRATITGTQATGATQTTTPVPTVVVSPSIYVAGGQGGFQFANPAFDRLWTRTDKPVAQGKVSRTWFWGPGPNTPGLLEQYNESPLGN